MQCVFLLLSVRCRCGLARVCLGRSPTPQDHSPGCRKLGSSISLVASVAGKFFTCPQQMYLVMMQGSSSFNPLASFNPRATPLRALRATCPCSPSGQVRSKLSRSFGGGVACVLRTRHCIATLEPFRQGGQFHHLRDQLRHIATALPRALIAFEAVQQLPGAWTQDNLPVYALLRDKPLAPQALAEVSWSSLGFARCATTEQYQSSGHSLATVALCCWTCSAPQGLQCCALEGVSGTTHLAYPNNNEKAWVVAGCPTSSQWRARAELRMARGLAAA